MPTTWSQPSRFLCDNCDEISHWWHQCPRAKDYARIGRRREERYNIRQARETQEAALNDYFNKTGRSRLVHTPSWKRQGDSQSSMSTPHPPPPTANDCLS